MQGKVSGFAPKSQNNLYLQRPSCESQEFFVYFATYYWGISYAIAFLGLRKRYPRVNPVPQPSKGAPRPFVVGRFRHVGNFSRMHWALMLVSFLSWRARPVCSPKASDSDARNRFHSLMIWAVDNFSPIIIFMQFPQNLQITHFCSDSRQIYS